MSALSINSSAAVIEAATFDELTDYMKANSAYDVLGDVSMCRNFIHAIRLVIQARPEETRVGADSVRDNAQNLRDQLEAAKQWLASNDTTASTTQAGGRVRAFSLRNFR